MWQGPSLLPKPRLSSARRADRPLNNVSASTPRTPSRIPRPLFKVGEDSTATQPKSTPPSRTPTTKLGRYASPHTKRGDTLAEQVIATGIIGSRNPQRTPKTPPRNLTTSHIPNTHFSNTARDFTTPDRKPARPDPAESHTPNELVIDEELVTRTPAKHKNAEWLASFGIDVSLLKLTDDEQDEENHDPNESPSPRFRKNDCQIDKPGSKSNPTNSRAFSRRRATDFYGYAQSSYDNLTGPPTRVASARKSRRASARVSCREIDALKFNEGVDVHVKEVEYDDVPRGSDIFLTPVRATRKQREKNGTPVVLSEVRRSLRINTPSSKLVPKKSVRGRIELLEANDHSYIPNPTLSDRALFSG